MTWVELCAGSAATTWRLLGGPQVVPPVSLMGGKRRYASAILAAFGLRPGQGADQVLLVDASSWGWAWRGLLDLEVREAVCVRLRSWSDRDPVELWRDLAAQPQADDPAEAVARWMWLQGRSASCTPRWWSGEDLSQGGGGVSTPGWRMGHHGQSEQEARTKGTGAGQANGLHSTETVAARIEVIADLVSSWLVLQAGSYYGKPVDWADGAWQHHGCARSSVTGASSACYSVDRVQLCVEQLPSQGIAVHHGDVRDVEPIPGAHVLFDPPYQGATGYEASLPREDVLEVARRWAAAGAVVAVCEAEPLPLEGWHHVDLRPVCPRREHPEWLTMSAPPVSVPGRQLPLLGA